MKFTDGADYAVQAVIELTLLQGGARDRTTVRQLQERLNIPGPFLGKILQRLVAAGILDAKRGAHSGGFKLARDAEKITIADVVAAVEGPIRITHCSSRSGGCPREGQCPAAPMWHRAQTALLSVLTTSTIAGILRAAASRTDLIPLDSGVGTTNGTGVAGARVVPSEV